MKSKFLFLLDLKWFLWIQHISKTSVKIPLLCSICKTIIIPINKKYIIIFPRKRPNLGCRDDFCKVKYKKDGYDIQSTLENRKTYSWELDNSSQTMQSPSWIMIPTTSDWEWKEGYRRTENRRVKLLCRVTAPETQGERDRSLMSDGRNAGAGWI